MIGKLTGMVDFVGTDHAIIDVHGVGYLVQASASTLARLQAGAAVSLVIETKMSEEAIRLYGFLADEEREWFRILQSVQGVGARVALGILSTLKIAELERAIALSDKAAIARTPGVGPKLALRLVTELKDKAPKMLLRRSAEGGGAVDLSAPNAAEADAVAALVKLGYSPSVASEAVARAAHSMGDAPVDALIRASLRQLAA